MNKQLIEKEQKINQLTEDFIKLIQTYYPDQKLTWLSMVDIHLDILKNLEKKYSTKLSAWIFNSFDAMINLRKGVNHGKNKTIKRKNKQIQNRPGSLLDRIRCRRRSGVELFSSNGFLRSSHALRQCGHPPG